MIRALRYPLRWILPLAVATVVAIAGAPARGQPSPQYPKRGWGGTASRYPSDVMNPNWYYNWGRTGIAGASSEFVPMAWGSSSVTNETNFAQLLGHPSDYILGFNEPERTDQANMTVEQAISLWPKLMSTGKKLVSPGVSDDATGRAWLTSFLAEINRLSLRVDAIAFHWYGDVRSSNSSAGFLNRVDWFHNNFTNAAGQKYPIWITEFGGIDWTGGVNPVTQEMNAQFLTGALPGLDSRSHVQRYAWFGWRDETSLGGGTPFTPTASGDLYNGRTYATGQTVTLAGNEGSDTFYLRGGTIQNSGSSKVIRALDAIEGTSRLTGDADWGITSGWMRIRAGATVAKYGASTFQVSGVRLTNDGNFYGKSGTMAFADGVIVDGTGVLRTEWSASPACGITLTESAPGRGGATIHNRVWLNGGQFTVPAGSHTIHGELQISSPSYATVGGTLTLTAAMTGPGSFGKTGTGTLRLEAASVNTGTFAVWAGTLVAANETGSVHGTGPLTINASGTLAGNGSIGGTSVSIIGTLAPSQATLRQRPLAFSAPLVFGASSRTILDVGPTASDAVTSSSSVTLAGSLTLVPQAPPPGLVPYEMLTADSLSGRYASIAGIDLGNGRRLAVTYTATSAVVTAGMAGDTNLDGGIDILDAAAFASSARFDTGSLASWGDGDFNGDGLVDVLDAADFAMSGLFDAGAYAAAELQVAAVPEPSAGLCAGVAAWLCAVMAWRRAGRVAGLSMTLAGALAAASAAAQVPSGYTIEAFRDEFDGDSLDTTKWNAGIINYPSGSTWLRRNHPGNNAVAGGFLIQTTLYQDVTGDGVPEWTCSSVGARSFSQRFGYWESRIRITDFDWTDNAWWSSDIGTGHLSGMDGFEIDAPEAWSPNRYTASIYDHAVQDGSAPSSIHFEQAMTGKNFTANFSVFGWDWGTDNSVRCFVDGALVHTFSAAVMNGIEALVPQGPVQGTALWTTGLTPTNQVADGDSKYIDYVRIYQKPGWSGTGAAKRWGDTANWGPDGVPASGRAAVFNTAAASGTITLATDQPVQEIVFQGGDTGIATIAGPGRLLLGMTTAVTATTGAIGGINLVNDTKASVSVAADIVAQRKLQFSNFAGASITPGPTPAVDLVLAGRLSAAEAGTPINFLTTAPIVVTGTIDGSIGRLTKGGQGVVRLHAANAFTGGLEIRDGIVEVNADGALGALGGGVTMSPGSAYDQPSLVLNAVAYSDPVPIAIQGGGTRAAHYPQSSGAIESSGTSRFAGPITAVDDATIFVQRSGHLTLSGTIDTRDHVLTLGSLGTLVVSGRVTGSSGGQLDKYNSGTTILGGDNTGFLGSVRVRLGTLSVNGDNALGGGTGDVVRLAGGTLRTTADFTSAKGGSFAAAAGNVIDTNGRTITFSGEFSGPGGFTKQGAGTLALGGSNSFLGMTRIQTGTLAAAHPAAFAWTTLDLASPDTGVLRLAVDGTATYLLGGLQGARDLAIGGNSLSVGHNGGSTTFSGRVLGTGGVSKVGGGVLTLGGSNAYSGTTEVRAGVLSISSTASLPGWNTPGRYVVSDGATLAVSNAISDAAIAAILQTGNLRDGAAIGFDTSAGTRTCSNDLGLQGRTVGLTKVGGAALIIDGSTTFLGPTTVAGGTLQLGTGGTTGSIASLSVAVAEGGVLAFNRSNDVVFPGSIRGAGDVVQRGAGTLVLSGSSDFTGTTRIVTGMLSLAHPAALGGSTLDLASGDLGSVQLDAIAPTAFVIGGLQGFRRFDIGAHTVVVGGNGGSTSYLGVIDGTGGLEKVGSGTFTLGADQLFTGRTVVQSGALQIGTGGTTGAVASSVIDVAAGATVMVNRRDNLRVLASITGAGAFLKLGTGTVELPGTNSFTGTARISTGVLSLTSTAALAGATLDLATGDSGTVSFGMSGPVTYQLGGLQGSRNLAIGDNSLTVGGNNATTMYGGVLSGSGRLTKAGGGTLTLAGTNMHTGGITILAGAVSVSADGRLGPAGAGLRLDGGALQTTAGMTLSTARAVTIAPGGGMIDHTGGSNLIVGGSVAGRDAVLAVRTSSPILGAAFLDGPVVLDGLDITGSTSGVGLRSSAVVGRAIQVDERQVLHVNGLNGTGTATATYRGFDVVLAGGTFRNRYGGNTFSRTLSLTADGTLENRAGNGNSLTLAGGTLALGAGTLTVRSGTSPAEWVAIGSRLTGGTSSGLVVTGGGRLRLSGSNADFDGRIVVEQGELRLELAAAVDAGVAIAFGSGTSAPKSLALDAVDVVVGRLDLSGTERIDLGTGSLTIAAGMSPERLVAALVAGRGDGSWRGGTGILSSAVASDLAAGRPRAVGWMATGGGTMRAAYAAAGDTNIDQVVDILDVANVLAGGAFDTGLPASWLQGEFNYDGVVDIVDLADFLGGGLIDAGPYDAAAAAVAGVVTVPEPAFFAVWPLLLALAATRVSRRQT